MNQRIQELIRLSAVPADRAEDYAIAKGLIEPTEKLDVVKFAELIVKETMQVVANNLPQNTYLDVADAVIEHFGVEE